HLLQIAPVSLERLRDGQAFLELVAASFGLALIYRGPFDRLPDRRANLPRMLDLPCELGQSLGLGPPLFGPLRAAAGRFLQRPALVEDAAQVRERATQLGQPAPVRFDRRGALHQPGEAGALRLGPAKPVLDRPPL